MSLECGALTERTTPDSIIHCRIVKNQPIAKSQWMIWLKPEQGRLPDFRLGNFCMLSIPDVVDPLLPRPFAIADAKDGMYGFIYRIHGKQTKALAALSGGARVDLLGPLGRGFSRSHFGRGEHIFIAGGVGYASLFPLIESLQETATGKVYYGVREELEVIRRGKISPSYASDNGSIGFHGRLPELIKSEKFSERAQFYVCGPTGMMKALHSLLPTQRSYYFLEETMGCGFGICVGCVVEVKTPEGVQRAKSCLEGPIFLGSHLSHWAAGASA